jgi:predicted enzyme related to lactoylglutathione lyase
MSMTLLLKCGELEETKTFYSDVLHFEVSDTADQTCTVRNGDSSIIFTAKTLWPGPPHCTGTIYFFLSDVDAYYDRVKDKADILWPLENMSYGTREFGVKDCNGYTLGFAKRL